VASAFAPLATTATAVIGTPVVGATTGQLILQFNCGMSAFFATFAVSAFRCFAGDGLVGNDHGRCGMSEGSTDEQGAEKE